MPRVAQPCVDGPEPCPCRYHARIKARQRAKRLGGGTARSQYNAWKGQHDALLIERLDAGATPEEIAHELTRRFKVPRTANAVKIRIPRLGRSLLEGWWTGAETARRLGLSWEVLQRLTDQGALIGCPYGAWTRYRVADVEAFVRAHAGTLIDPRRIRDPRLRSLAETSAIANKRRQSA